MKELWRKDYVKLKITDFFLIAIEITKPKVKKNGKQSVYIHRRTTGRLSRFHVFYT